jgi:WD40 repeat protein
MFAGKGGGFLSRLTNPRDDQIERWSGKDATLGTNYDDDHGRGDNNDEMNGKRSLDEFKTCKWILEGHESAVTSVTIFREYILSGSEDGKIKGWSLTNRDCLFTLTAHTESVTCLITSSDGQLLVSSSLDQKIKGWSLDTHQCLFTLEGHEKGVCSVVLAHHKNKTIVISGSADRTIKGWDVTDSSCLFTLFGHTEKINALTLLPDDRIASASDDSTIKVWNLNSHECAFTLTGHQCGVSSVTLSSSSDQQQGKYLLSGSDDQTIKVWCVATRACIFTFTDDN